LIVCPTLKKLGKCVSGVEKHIQVAILHSVPRIVVLVSKHALAIACDIAHVLTRALHGAMPVFTPAQVGF